MDFRCIVCIHRQQGGLQARSPREAISHNKLMFNVCDVRDSSLTVVVYLSYSLQFVVSGSVLKRRLRLDFRRIVSEHVLPTTGEVEM